MAVGRPIDKQTIDYQIAAFGVQLNNLFTQIKQFTLTLDAIGDSTFTTAGIPKTPTDPTVLATYTSGELTQLRTAYRDLNKLALVYTGAWYVASGATVNSGVPTANDATHFGYPFSMAVGALDGLGY
jgi:hypothetical protein